MSIKITMEENKKISVIIAAAGTSSRMGLNTSKQSLLLDDKPLLSHSIEKFLKLKNLIEIIVVTNDIKATNKIISSPRNDTFQVAIKIVPGGKLRQDSVYNGFCEVDELNDLVLIHDVARPLFEISDVEKCIEKAILSGACILALPVVDTIKKVNNSNNELIVESTLRRDNLYLVQTPQVFGFALLQEVYKKYRTSSGFSEIVTDEAMLVEKYGKPVNLVSGSKKNIKITYSDDLEIAEAIIREEKEQGDLCLKL